MTDEFFALKYTAGNPEGYCTVDQLEGFEDAWAVGQGVSLAATPPGKLTMSMYADEPRNTVLADNVQNMDCLLIVSPRLRAFLEEQQLNNVEYYPLEIKDHKGKVASNEYFIAHLTNPVDCIDPEASGAKWIGEGLATKRIMSLKKLVLDPTRVPNDRKLFFAKYYNEVPLLRRELAEAMTLEKFTNVRTVPLSKGVR
ncbi:MAG: DUF1629 domain-containing protein [Burkholderiales bacterium]